LVRCHITGRTVFTEYSKLKLLKSGKRSAHFLSKRRLVRSTPLFIASAGMIHSPPRENTCMYQLRTAADVKRLFSALGDELEHESMGDSLSLATVEQDALQAYTPEDLSSLYISLLVAGATGWAAIKGFQRNAGSVPWGLAWGVLGFMFPVPAVVYSAVKN
jgi:hypothetical protein